MSAAAFAVRLVRAIRLRDWWHFLLLPIASGGPVAAVARGGGIAFGILAFGYLINGLSDRKVDGDQRKNPLTLVEPGAALVAVAFAALALALSFTGPLAVTLATLCSLTAGTLYSVGPRLKRFPLVGTLANAACFAPLLWVGVPDGAPRSDLARLAGLFVLLLLQNQLIHEAADRNDDERGLVLTTVRAVGRRVAGLVTAGLGLGMVLLAPHLALALALLAVFVAFFPAALFLRGDEVAAMRTLRLVHRVACILAGGALFGVLRLFPA